MIPTFDKPFSFKSILEESLKSLSSEYNNGKWSAIFHVRPEDIEHATDSIHWIGDSLPEIFTGDIRLGVIEDKVLKIYISVGSYAYESRLTLIPKGNDWEFPFDYRPESMENKNNKTEEEIK